MPRSTRTSTPVPGSVPAPRTALALRHVAFEDLGILAPVLEQRGYDISYLDSGLDPLAPDALLAPDLVVVLGGPIGVGDADRYPEVSEEIEAIRRRLQAGHPTLGICLGAQFMAAALGADVGPTGRTEIGYAPLTLTELDRDPVLAPLVDVPVLHWHGDQFQIPEGAASLAGTPGFPNQAFSLGADVLGLQFHLEADSSRIEQWLIGHAHELAASGIDPRTIRTDAARYGSRLEAAGREVFGTWLDRIG